LENTHLEPPDKILVRGPGGKGSVIKTNSQDEQQYNVQLSRLAATRNMSFCDKVKANIQ